MSDDQQILVCIRTADMPATPSATGVEKCRDCGEKVWTSNSAVTQFDQSKPIEFICLQCLDKMDEDDMHILPPNEKVIEDVAKSIVKGMSPEWLNRN